MRFNVRYILLILVSIVAIGLYGQDARIAHPFLWDSYYNPATCGADGLLKIDLGAQTNYTHLQSLFVDSHFSSEIGFGSKNVTWGVGLNLNNEYQGLGLLNVSSFNPKVSVGIKLQDNRGVYSTLRVGTSFDIGSSHINRNKMVWGDQLDPYYGKVLAESVEMQYIYHETLWSFDLSAGIFGQTAIDGSVYRMPIILNYGLSFAHIIGSNNPSFYSGQKSFLYMPDLYYRRFTAQMEYSHPYETRNRLNMYFTGYGIYEYQGGMHDFQLGFVYKVFRFMVGIGAKIEKFNAYTATNIMFHAVYSQPLGSTYGNRHALMRIAYTFETPLTQGSVLETSIHSVSIHFVVDYQTLLRRHDRCRDYSHPSDAAWYEMNNTFPNGR